MTNAPSPSEVTVRVESVPVNVAVIVAPGTIAPEGSFTVPRISPLVWPQAAPDSNRLANTNTYTHDHPVRFIAAPLDKAGAATPPRRSALSFRLQLAKKPYYNPRTLEDGLQVVKGKLIWRALESGRHRIRARAATSASAKSPKSDR